VDWINLPYKGVQWRAAVITTMNFRVIQNAHLGSVVAEDGGASTDVNVRTQKARGSFYKLR
jgi:hypothetical protein